MFIMWFDRNLFVFQEIESEISQDTQSRSCQFYFMTSDFILRLNIIILGHKQFYEISY